ncbi:MAG: SDR family NAD(P)-dependent oxidoreductase [Nocardioidaceae bacterium]
MTADQEFHGVRAVVTGGASGIGAATASMLRERGATVCSLDLASEGTPDGCVHVRCDVTDEAATTAAVEHAAHELGGIDVVVNNAGVGASGTVEDSDDDTFRRLHEVNVLGAVRVTRAALPHLRQSAHAAVVNTVSVAATVGLPERAAYSASKGALLSLTLAMAADHLRDGVRVNCVAPGTADTPWVQRLLAEAEDPSAARLLLESRQPTRRLVTAEEVARAICALASPLASSSTGSVVTVDGGLTTVRLPSR